MIRTLLFVGIASLYCFAACSSNSDDGTDSPSRGGKSGSAGSTNTAKGGSGSGGTQSKPGSGGGNTSSGGSSNNNGGSSSNTGGSNNNTAGTNNAGSGGASSAGTGGSSAGNSGTSGSSGAGNTDILEPAQGALLGQYYGDGSIAETAARLGRTLKMHLTYYDFTHDWTRGETKRDLDAGRIPFVNWEVFDTKLDDIINGSKDAMLADRARDAKALGKKFFIDFGAEMNGEWSPWGGAQNGQTAEKYIAAYQHVHKAMASADNLIWVWCPNVTDEPRQSWNEAMKYYPGDAYVDWTCVDGYNWGTSNGMSWQSFKDVFKGIYPKLAAKGKPIMIGEMASAEVGGDKAKWIDAIIPTLKSDYPLIKGVIWFDINKETDWRINSSQASLDAFKKLAGDAYFNP